MEVYMNICAEYDDRQVKRCAELINESIENHGLFQSEIPNVVDTHLKEITVLLQSVKTRNQGFQLLLPVIQQGSQELIEKRSDLWFGTCSQAVITLCGASEKKNACQIITILLKAASNLPELQKTFFTKSPASLIQSLAAADSSWNCAALECLYEFIKLFPGQCLSQKVVIEEHMLKYLDNPLARVDQDDDVKRAGLVYAALPLPGMSGNKAQGRAEARGRQVTQLLALAHSTMDMLFEGIVERESYSHIRKCNLKIHPIKFDGNTSADAVRGFLAAVTRLGNILKFVSQMLTSDSNESISLVPHHALGPLFRLLQVDSKILKSYRSQEHQLLAFLISSLHHHCLLLLRDLIMSIGEGIDLYFGVIADLLLSVIKMSFTNDESAWCASGIQTRIIAYSVMATVIQASRGRHTPSKELVTLMLQDIIPKSQQVTLLKTQGKGLSSLTVQKKKKKKGYSIKQNAKKHAGPFFQLEPLSRVTRAALALAETLYAHASHSLPHKTKQILQTSIIKVAESITGGTNLPEAYTNGNTRAQMYRTLASLATHPDPRCPPPYTMILYLLQHGQQDQQMLVVSTCQALIGNVSFIVANPQISDMILALQHSKIPNGQDMEEDSAENDPTEITPDQSEEEKQDSDDDEGDDAEGDDDEGDDMEGDDVMEEEETEENVVPTHPNEIITESKEMENGDDITDGEESDDVEQVDTEKSHKTHDIKDIENQNDVEEIELTETRRKIDKTDTVSVKIISEVVAQFPFKRKTEEDTSNTQKKNKRKNNRKTDGPSLEDMLGSFVDADPDEQ